MLAVRLTYARAVDKRSPFEDPDALARAAEILNRGYKRHVEAKQTREQTPPTIPGEVAGAMLRRAAHTVDGRSVVQCDQGDEMSLEEALGLVEGADDITADDERRLVVVADDECHRFDVGAPLTGL